MLTICIRRRRFESVRWFAASALMFGATASAAFAQDRSPRAADATGPSATESGLLPEPGFIRKAITRADSELNPGGEPKDGFFPELGNMITGSGWISAGPGYRHQ